MIRPYRALLRLYPRGFRADYGEALCHTFEERTRGLSAPRVFLAAIADAIPNAIGAHWDNLRYGVSGGFSLPSVGSDVRLALRQIRRAPLFSGVLISVIALGIGINTGLLTTLDAYALRVAPGIAPDARLARLLAAAVVPRRPGSPRAPRRLHRRRRVGLEHHRGRLRRRRRVDGCVLHHRQLLPDPGRLPGRRHRVPRRRRPLGPADGRDRALALDAPTSAAQRTRSARPSGS